MYIKDTLKASISGNAGTATKLATARSINGTNFDGSAGITTANWGTARTLTIGSKGQSVNGGGNVSWALSDIMGRATTSSSADANKDKYTKFARVDISGGTYRTCAGTFDFVSVESGHVFGILTYYLRTGSAITSTAITLAWKTLTDVAYANSVVAVKVSDGIFDLYYKPVNNWDTMSITNINSNGIGYITLYSGQSFTSSVTAAATSSLVNHSATAAKLTTARTINGTSFDGSANITTANWGTARTITVGNTGKSVNGSGNISWSLAEIGAYPSSGGNLSGSLHLSTDNTSISGVCGGGTDRWTIQGGGADDNGYLEINTKDNGNEPILCRQYSSSTVSRTAYLLNGDGNTTFPGRIAEQGTWLSDKYAAKSHGHNEIWVKSAPFNSSNDTTANWGGQGVSVSWYPDGTTITDKPNSWGFIFNIGQGTEVHQMWFSQATGTTYHRGGNGSGWSGSWRAILDSANYSSYAAPASHSHSYLPLSGGTLSGAIQVSGESRFYNTTYSDPWSGQGCAIKATGAIAATGIIKTNQYLQVGSCPLSIQSSAPGCGGVWIQI